MECHEARASSRQGESRRAISLTSGRQKGAVLGMSVKAPRLGPPSGAPRASEESQALKTPESSGESSTMRRCSGSPAYFSVGRKRMRSNAAWRQHETYRIHSRWRCFRAQCAYCPCACVGPWQHPRRSGNPRSDFSQLTDKSVDLLAPFTDCAKSKPNNRWKRPHVCFEHPDRSQQRAVPGTVAINGRSKVFARYGLRSLVHWLNPIGPMVDS